MAIASSIDFSTCNFVQIHIDNHMYCGDFLIETNHKLIESKITVFLGLDEMKVQEMAQTIKLDKYIYGRGNCIKGLSIEQVQYLFRIANNPRASKYKPLLLEAMFTQIMPLFNQQQELSTNVSTQKSAVEPCAAECEVMTSLEIAELTGKAHKNVLVDIEKIINELGTELKIQLSEYKDKTGRKLKCYNLDREATLLLTSGYSAPLRLKIIRRLDELENRTHAPVVPNSLPDALRLAANLVEERDVAIKTKAQIGSKREATAMATAGVLAKRLKHLEMKLVEVANSPNYEYATVLAIQSRMKFVKVSGLRLTYYCNKHGLVMKDIPDDRFGKVHSYPASAWLGVYGIDINQVLKRVA